MAWLGASAGGPRRGEGEAGMLGSPGGSGLSRHPMPRALTDRKVCWTPLDSPMPASDISPNFINKRTRGWLPTVVLRKPLAAPPARVDLPVGLLGHSPW